MQHCKEAELTCSVNEHKSSAISDWSLSEQPLQQHKKKELLDAVQDER